VLFLWWLPSAFPQPDANYKPAGPTAPWREKRVEFERDRVQGGAKGIASTAAGFLVALLLAAFKSEIQGNVSAWSIIGCIAGAVGALLLAAILSASTRRFVRAPSKPVLNWPTWKFPMA
jgi:hypothetical protein